MSLADVFRASIRSVYTVQTGSTLQGWMNIVRVVGPATSGVESLVAWQRGRDDLSHRLDLISFNY